MASRQDKEQRAGNRVVTEHDPEERTGVIGSVMRAVHSAKEAVVGRRRDEHRRKDAGDGGDDRSREEMTELAAGAMDEKAREAAGETKDYTAEKARETAKKTKETAESAADKTKEKAQEAKETVDKTKETTQSATSKLGELKGKAMGLFSGKKGDSKEQSYETTKENLRETEEETRRRMEELRLKGGDEYVGDVARGVREGKDESERRGGGILGALGSLKEKLTSHPTPSDPVDESREPRTREDVSPGAVESTLKTSDQLSG